MFDMTHGEKQWTPDRQTVLWAISVMDERRISDTVRSEFQDRREELAESSAEYWELITGITVEHITFDLVEQAKKWGTDFSSVDWGPPNDR
ncbi:hypothetical protein [Actinokineospora iranica]|uniref:Uncharacterized protein n=1 Tax=Actinokineospora iranica TaxID=1271860 RepID=A0A1G6KNC2_9PSEU|nr:hypothetical protein [Actinokineospora iranica]SDC32321.1 hypothetical protein SAMN05216174_1011001 [Actinokineospora iranica]